MLNHKIVIWVPSTVNGNQPAPPELIAKWVRAAKILMSGLFGGFTTYNGQGGWYSPTNGLVEENVTIIQSFTDEEGLTKLDQVNELAKAIANDMSQEIVSVEVDGTLNFVTA